MVIISRNSWGARAPTSVSRLSSVNRVFIHYTGMDADEQENHANCASRVKGVQSFHMSNTPSDPSKPWSDIAYSFLVCKHGFTFEGRGFDIRTAATGPCNGDSLAICFLGDDSANRDDVTDLGRKAIADTVAAIRKRYGNVSVHGHRDCMGTACPGDQLYNWLKSGLPVDEEEDDLPSAEEIAEAVWNQRLAYGGKQVYARTILARAASGSGQVDVQALADELVSRGLGPAMVNELAARLAD